MAGYEVGLQSNQLKDFSVTIGGTLLTNAQVNEIKVKWNIANFRIVGHLAFKDMSNIVERQPIRADTEIELAMTDHEDVVSSQKMRVIDIGYERSIGGPPLVVLRFVDPLTIEATKLYKALSWASADLGQLVNNKETLQPYFDKKTTDFGSLPKFENFVMPLHVPLNVTMHWVAKNSNVMFFQTRDKIVAQPLKHLFGQEVAGEKFYYKSPNNTYRRRIYQLATNYGKMIESNAFQPKGKVASFSTDSKHSSYIEESFADIQSKISSPGKTDQELPETGERHYYKSSSNIEGATEFQWAKNAYKGVLVEILVPGQFETNVGDIVDLDLVNFTSPKEPEKNISGKWMIIEMVDVFSPPDFVQRLTLARAKFST